MAIDGTKIIDSDLAHDIDSEFMELYDSGKDIDFIKNKIEKWRACTFDDCEKEIFITTYALNLWKIGALTGEILQEVKEVIAKGSGVSMWREEGGEKDAAAREKELINLISKISIPKDRPQPRKKLKKAEDFVFQIDDAIIFKAENNIYYAAIMLNVFQHKGRCIYYFTPTTYKGTDKPTLENILNSELLGSKIPTGFTKAQVKQKQPNIEKFWEEDNTQMPFIVGLEHIGVNHKDLAKFSDKLEVIGKIAIEPGFKEGSLYDGASDFGAFSQHFVTQEQHLAIPAFKADKIPVKKLV